MIDSIPKKRPGARVKLGTWLPVREPQESISLASPGILLRSLRAAVVDQLERSQQFELVSDLDFRRASIHHGRVELGAFSFGDLDAFFWFGEIDRTPAGYDLSVLEAIADHAAVINGAAAQRLALDKYNTQRALQRAGVDVPEYHLVSTRSIEAMRDRFAGKQYLLKPRLGSFGVGIVKAGSYEDLVDVADYAGEPVHLIEEYIPCTPDSWIGVSVIGSKIGFGYTKDFASRSPAASARARDDHAWKHCDRLRRGGNMRLKQPTPRQAEIAIEVGKVLGLDLFGVDMVMTRDGRALVIDVNTFPALYPELFAAAGVDGAQLIVDMLLDRLAPAPSAIARRVAGESPQADKERALV